MLGEPQKIKIGEKEFDQVGLLSANAIHTALHGYPEQLLTMSQKKVAKPLQQCHPKLLTEN